MTNRERAKTIFITWRSETDQNPLEARLAELIERALDEAEKRGAEKMRERAAKLAEDFNWVLPLFEKQELDEATDDVACEVCKQAGEAILALPIDSND